MGESLCFPIWKVTYVILRLISHVVTTMNEPWESPGLRARHMPAADGAGALLRVRQVPAWRRGPLPSQSKYQLLCPSTHPPLSQSSLPSFPPSLLPITYYLSAYYPSIISIYLSSIIYYIFIYHLVYYLSSTNHRSIYNFPMSIRLPS